MKATLPVPTTKPQKVTATVVDTIIVTPSIVKSWASPVFQRPFRLNDRVIEISVEIRETQVIPGVITLAVLDHKTYLLDGQHRREAFLLSEVKEGFVDVRMHYFEDLAAMGEEFVRLNSRIVALKPDDVLRGMEPSIEGLRIIRNACPFVGYDMIRRSEKAPLISMSLALRAWRGSSPDVPQSVGESSLTLAKALTRESAEELAEFLKLAHIAWGKDEEYSRLWGALNTILCMWAYRRLVLHPWNARTPKVSKELFTKLLMSLSADGTYLDWLTGRRLGDRDRSPCYTRIKSIFSKRLEQELGKKVGLPAPPWATH